jgi:hypothetical protein
MKTHNSWLRLRGNASGRNGFNLPKRWHCDGCDKVHAATTERTIGLDGKAYCNRTYVPGKRTEVC